MIGEKSTAKFGKGGINGIMSIPKYLMQRGSRYQCEGFHIHRNKVLMYKILQVLGVTLLYNRPIGKVRISESLRRGSKYDIRLK